MRLSTCLWGGIYNPIIPVPTRLPATWRKERFYKNPVSKIVNGCIDFFEPDVFVEAEKGLAESLGINAKAHFGFHHRVIQLSDWLRRDKDDDTDFEFGLNVFDLYRHLYNNEFKFLQRKKEKFLIFKGKGSDPFFEAAFGVFPNDRDLEYIRKGYTEVFEPREISASPEAWLKAVQDRLQSPHHVGIRELNVSGRGGHDPKIFILDPTSTSDLIDYWNLRCFQRGVLPVPIQWLKESSKYIRKVVEKNYRPLPRNPNGVMTHTTVELGRSVDEEFAKKILTKSLSGVKSGSWGIKPWYTPIWDRHLDSVSWRERRVSVEAQKQEFEREIDKDTRYVRLPGLSPKFSDRYSRGIGWVNVLNLESFRSRSDVPLVLPSNIRNTDWPGPGFLEGCVVSRDGYVMPGHLSRTIFLEAWPAKEAIIRWLGHAGIDAVPSNSGRIADQILESVGGLGGTHLFTNEGVLRLLDKMSKSVRIQELNSHVTAEEYPDRTATVDEWKQVIGEKNKSEQQWVKYTLNDYTSKSILRLGISISCPNCQKQNWYSLKAVDYRIQCEQCLSDFDFPQGGLKYNKDDWKFRVAGPFTMPNFADGGYAVVLSLDLFANRLATHNARIGWSTGLDLDGQKLEADFVCWYQGTRIAGEGNETHVIFGEAKSFAKESITEKSIANLKRLALKFPGSFLTFAVLKKSFSDREKKLLRKLALWGREFLNSGVPRAPVILITGNEFFGRSVEDSWKHLGGKWASLIKHPSVRVDNLWTFSNLTQQLYLDLPSHHEWLDQKWKKKAARRKTKAK